MRGPGLRSLVLAALLPAAAIAAPSPPDDLPLLAVPPARVRPPPPPVTDAASARAAFDREAAQAIVRTPRGHARPWHELKWIYDGPGAVGRLHDLCTGAVEPKPTLSLGRRWAWETLDPRRLNTADRELLLEWRGQTFASLYGCGTVFEIGDLGSRARTAAGTPRTPGVHVSEVFVSYVDRHPELRRSNDLVGVAAAALRETAQR